jgi:hypothetical protein
MSTKKTLYMETTQIPAERTAAEISSCLIQAGATQIATDYEGGEIKGLRWTMQIHGQDVLFAMPARVDPIFKALNDRRQSSYLRQNKAPDDRAQAKRVGWRQLLRWVQAQVAMIECGMTEAAEVFFPYIQIPGTNQTLFQRFKDQKSLPTPQDNLQ